ncbi:hypothetical protein AAHH67_24950 [Niallia circulans]
MLLKQIANRTDYTTAEKNIAKYILENANLIERMTIQELAQKTFTSHTSIIRFTQKLGMKGFKDFKIMLVKTIEQKTMFYLKLIPISHLKMMLLL